MLRNFALTAFAGFFLVATAFVVPVSVVKTPPVAAETGKQA